MATEGRAAAPALRDAPATFVRARIRVIDPAMPDWQPVDAYFRKDTERWTLVGVDRFPSP